MNAVHLRQCTLAVAHISTGNVKADVVDDNVSVSTGFSLEEENLAFTFKA